MRNILITVALIFSPVFAFGVEEDPVALTINGEPIKKSEFEYIYKKNSSVSSSEKKSIDEYVEMFVNYKLKVLDAKSEQLNLTDSYLKEYERYENQLTYPYMSDKETTEYLMSEAVKRMNHSILASHILVKCETSDTLAAWNKINSIYKKLKNGEPFEKLAKEFSDCPSGATGGSLGFVNVFSTVYDFENVAYTTPEGSYSAPFRTDFGYHIVKVFKVKPNYKKRRVSHILFMNNKNGFDLLADSIFKIATKDNEDFASLARKYSDDEGSAGKGGDLGFLEDGSFPQVFTHSLSGLDAVGDIVKVGSAFGVHIVKLTEVVKFETVDDCGADFEKKVKNSDRFDLSSLAYEKYLKEKYGVRVFEESIKAFDMIVKEKNKEIRKNRLYQNLDAPLYTFMGNTYPQVDFLRFFLSELEDFEILKSSGKLKDPELREREFSKEKLQVFLFRKMLDEEKKHLRETNVDYRNLITEYSDGLLLFEISAKKVWNKAVIDTSALRVFFEKNKEKYRWNEPRYKGFVVYSSTEKIKKKVDEIVKTTSMENINSSIFKEFNTTASDEVMVKEGLFPKGKNHAVDVMMFKEGEYKNEKYPYVSLRGSLISAPECYEDVKGLVTADYQDYLEKEWVKSLREKYKVKVNKDVLKTIK
jgi:peptidyl-prolyl cis-trans isomerase SurA